MKEKKHLEIARKKSIDLFNEYCTYVAVRRCLNDDEIINKHFINVYARLSDDDKKLLLDCVSSSFIKINEKILFTGLIVDEEEKRQLSQHYQKIFNTPFDKFPIDKIIEAINFIKNPKMVYSLDFKENEYEAIKETLPLEIARKKVIMLRKLKEISKNSSCAKKNSNSR